MHVNFINGILLVGQCGEYRRKFGRGLRIWPFHFLLTEDEE